MAISTRIKYNPGLTAGGQHLFNAVHYVQLAQQEIALAVTIANAITGGGVTGANLEGCAEFGTEVAAGTGQALYDAMNTMKVNLATVTAAQIGALFQG